MKRRRTQEEKECAEQANKLLRAWLAWHREERKAALAGPHADMLERLFFILAELKPSSAPTLLLAYVSAVDWSTVDLETRQAALHEIDAAVIKLRTRAELAPFDDGLPGDRLPVFLAIKSILFPADDAGANRGGARLRNLNTNLKELKPCPMV
jgi:hypothetical protein